MTSFIAEICSNHNGSLSRALTLVDTAAEIGCSGVKFQLFRLDKLYAPEVLNHPDYSFVRQRRAWELPIEWLPVLSNRAKERGIKFGCTPFYLEAVDELLPFVDFYKIASYSLLHDDLLVKVARTEKPVILSTGMGTYEEIKRAIDILITNGIDDNRKLVVLHCVSVYPNSIQVRGRDFNRLIALCSEYSPIIPWGWSDHSAQPMILWWAIFRRNSDVIEFHLDLDGQGREYGLGHCWLPNQVEPIIKVHNEANGTAYGEGFSESEATERLWRADPSDGLRPVREMRERL